MTSQTRKQTITIHVLPVISRSKCNQTIKFGQLIECNRNIFLEKSSTKCSRKTSPRSFFKKSKLSISRDQVWSFIQFVIIVCPSWGLPKDIETKVLTTWFYFTYKAFLQNKKGFETCLPTSFSAWFLKKNIYRYRISLSDCLHFLRYLAICVL